VPKELARFHGGANFHFITTSCYRREPLLGTARVRDTFLEVFKQVRRRYDFDVIGYVVMPEHVHILVSEPKRRTLPVLVQVLKQRVAKRMLPKRKTASQGELWETPIRRRFRQRRYYDFNVYSDRKVTEKLRYMHWNPVKRGLVSSPELWRWSSYRAFAFGEEGVVKLNWQQRMVDETKSAAANSAADSISAHPPKIAEGRAPSSLISHRKAKAQNVR
jgi:putative transposase